LCYWGALTPGILSTIWKTGSPIILDISLFDQRLTFVSLYGYNSDEPEMFNEIMKNIASYSNTSYLLCVNGCAKGHLEQTLTFCAKPFCFQMEDDDDDRSIS
jgi:uncharacterized protein (UPF0303 family)